MAVVNDNRPEVFVGMDVVHFKELWRSACKDQASQVNVTTLGVRLRRHKVRILLVEITMIKKLLQKTVEMKAVELLQKVLK